MKDINITKILEQRERINEHEEKFINNLVDDIKNNNSPNSNPEIQELIKYFDRESENIDQLKDIPKSKMRLYGYSDTLYGTRKYFDSEEELIKHIRNNDKQFTNIEIIDYIGNIAGRSDVIRVTSKNGIEKLYTVIDEDGYAICNVEKSLHEKEFIWEYNYGEIKEMYSAFRNRGIIFEDDKYGKLDEMYRRIYNLWAKEEETLPKQRKK